LDNDGDQDLYANIGGFIPGDKYNKALFANPAGKSNWISIKLSGVKSNRAAIGAKIKLTITDSTGKPSIRYREVTSGGSFGASPLAQHVGLGQDVKNGRIDAIDVWWPASKSHQTFHDVAANQFIEIREFSSDYQPRSLRSFSFGKT